MEAQLAEYMQANKSRLPVVAFMAGKFMDKMPGMRFGHAGTIVEGRQDTAEEKIRRLREAGIAVAEEIEQIPGLVRERL
jgi:succinyl-CoA synthetase alpha subunit